MVASITQLSDRFFFTSVLSPNTVCELVRERFGFVQLECRLANVAAVMLLVAAIVAAALALLVAAAALTVTTATAAVELVLRPLAITSQLFAFVNCSKFLST